MVIVLDNWILRCGQRAAALVLHSVPDHPRVTRRAGGGATAERTVRTLRECYDILCMHLSHMDCMTES